MALLLPHDWRVPAAFRDRLGDAAGRQRAMAAEGHLLLVLHEPPTPGAADRAAWLFWRDPTGDWRCSPRGVGPQALERHVRAFAERAGELEARWQSAATAADYFSLLRLVAPLHRTVRNLHAALQQARELAPEDRDLINLRDQAGEVERSVELLHGDARNGLDFTVAREAERQADRTREMAVAAHRLNLLAATFFPVATLGAVFGMNLAHGLEGWVTPAHFWAVLGLGLVAGAVTARFIARKPAPVAEPLPGSKTGRPNRRAT